MIARPFVLCLSALLGAVLVSCTSISVAPEPDLARTLAATRRPDLGFSLVQGTDERLRNENASARSYAMLEGDSLELATLAFREALVGTEAFGQIGRADAGQGLHCAFELRTIGGAALGGILFALTVGLCPDHAYEEYELVATVTAPGKEARTYRARTSSGTWLWLPLLPIGIVQQLTQRGGLQETVDSIATQMANGGWLGA